MVSLHPLNIRSLRPSSSKSSVHLWWHHPGHCCCYSTKRLIMILLFPFIAINFFPFPFSTRPFGKSGPKWFSIAPCMTNGWNMLKSLQKCPWEDKWIFSRIINLINKFACIFIRAIEVFPAQLDERCCVITSSFTFCHPPPFVWITEGRGVGDMCLHVCGLGFTCMCSYC